MNYIYPILWAALVVAAMSTTYNIFIKTDLAYLGLWIMAVGICVFYGIDKEERQLQ